MTEAEHKDVVQYHEAGHLVVMFLLELPIGHFKWLEGGNAQVEALATEPDILNLYKFLVVKAASRQAQALSKFESSDTEDESFYDDDMQISHLLGVLYNDGRQLAIKENRRFCSRGLFKKTALALVDAEVCLMFCQVPFQEFVINVAKLLDGQKEFEGEDLTKKIEQEFQKIKIGGGAIEELQLYPTFIQLYKFNWLHH